MKILIPVSVSALLVGCLIGYNLPSKPHHLELETKESNQSDVIADQSGPNEGKLEKLVKELEKENQLLRETLLQPTEELVEAEDSDSMKKRWIDEILNQSDGNRGRTKRDLRRISKQLDLTPDQLIQLELLSSQRDQQRKLRMLTMLGLVDQESSDYADIRGFDYEEAFFGILSEEQKASYEEGVSQRQEQSANVIAGMMTERYQLTDSEKFSADEQSAINDIFKSAIKQGSDNIRIPEAIDSLQLNQDEKRILAASYESMDSELFEKVYESIVNNRQTGEGFGGGPRGGFGGGRQPRR